jgi:hypothetical protein
MLTGMVKINYAKKCTAAKHPNQAQEQPFFQQHRMCATLYLGEVKVKL